MFVTNSMMLGSVYILMAMMLVVAALISRREKPMRLLTMALAWVAIFAGGFALFTFRDDLGWVMQRLRAEATGQPVEQAGEIRIPMAIDGHFWVEADVNGSPVKFLVDSGATMTTIGRSTAARVGIAPETGRDEIVRTGNGIVRMQAGRADTLALGPVERRGMLLHIADSNDLNVLGMNFLSSLDRWGVEGRWLILEP